MSESDLRKMICDCNALVSLLHKFQDRLFPVVKQEVTKSQPVDQTISSDYYDQEIVEPIPDDVDLVLEKDSTEHVYSQPTEMYERPFAV